MTFLIKTALFNPSFPAPFSYKKDGRNFVVDADSYDLAFIKVSNHLMDTNSDLAKERLDGASIEIPLYEYNAKSYINASHAIFEIEEAVRDENIRL